MPNFKKISGSDIQDLTLRAWKKEPEKRKESKNEDNRQGTKNKRKENQKSLTWPQRSYYVEKMGETET